MTMPHRSAATLAAALMVITLGFNPAAAVTSPAVLFQDDFTGAAGTTFDHSKWRDYSSCTDSKAGWGDIRCGDNETLDGAGHLRVPATATTGSGLMTAGKFSFKYGTISAWIKVPKTVGYWPAFWTENRPQNFTSTPLYGEMDAMEIYTFQPQYAHGGGMHAWTPTSQLWGGTDNFCTTPGVTNYGDAYHKYSVKFEPTRVTGFIDNVQCGPAVVKSTDPHKPWPFPPDVNLANYLILDLAVGGAGGQQPVPPRPDVMLVDRVEVRALT